LEFHKVVTHSLTAYVVEKSCQTIQDYTNTNEIFSVIGELIGLEQDFFIIGARTAGINAVSL